MMDSILNSVKKMLGPSESDPYFDDALILFINSVFNILYQLGVGPITGFSITSADDNWSDYLEEGANLEMVKVYMYSKVRLQFDPPLNASVLEALKEQINEYEWRLNSAVDYPRRTK